MEAPQSRRVETGMGKRQVVCKWIQEIRCTARWRHPIGGKAMVIYEVHEVVV